MLMWYVVLSATAAPIENRVPGPTTKAPFKLSTRISALGPLTVVAPSSAV